MGLLFNGNRLVKDAFSGLLDLIYPPHCLICRAADASYLCASCIEKIDLIKPPFCRKCGTPCESYNCEDCREREYHFECARSAGIFEGVLRDAIHALKYRNLVAVAEPLAEIMAESFRETGLAGKTDIVVPIPVHISRKIRRGFNQSEELARGFANRVHLPIAPHVLCKSKKTKRQVELPLDLRVSNVHGTFTVQNSEKIRGKRILLIDDVFTTGSTLDEAAKLLLESGASSVSAYTLAKSL